MGEKIILTQTAPGTFQVASGGSDGNPFAMQTTPTAATMQATMTQGYRAQLPNGEWIYFASEADYLKANNYLRSMQGQQGSALGGPTLGGGGGGGMSTGNWVRTGAESAETVIGYLQGRALDRKIDDLQESQERLRTALGNVEALRSKYPELVPALIDVIQAQQDSIATSQDLIEDEITAVDIKSGAGAAKVISQFLGNSSSSNSSGLGSGLALGAMGLGVGVLLSRDSSSSRRSRRR